MSKSVFDLSPEELARLANEAGREAAARTWAAGRSVTGIEMVEIDGVMRQCLVAVSPEGIQTVLEVLDQEPARKSPSKPQAGRRHAVA